jgi:hypothetical protein
MTTSTLMSGQSGRHVSRAGHRTASAAFSVAVIRMAPAGFVRNALSAAPTRSEARQGVL